MIDQSRPDTECVQEAGAPRLPVPAGLGRGLVLLAVFICAACGLIYELALVALASYLVGDSVTQASVVLSLMVFAMGVGSLLAKRWRGGAAAGFAVVEVLLALFGGLSAFALYGSFAWFGQSKPVLVAFSLGIGLLIGAEIPLLMMLIQRIRRQDPVNAVADLVAADYVGALVGGLAFPFLLLPRLGQLDAALVTGAVNAVAGGGIVLWLFRSDLTARSRLGLCAANAAVLVVLVLAALFAGQFEAAARQAIHGSAVRMAERTAVQEVVLTGRGPESLRLFLDGRLRVSGRDEYRYHEALVHPAMAGPRDSVLVLGGGDGLALREVLRYSDVRTVTVVDNDPGLVRIARTDPGLSALNERAHEDPRVRSVTADTFDWLRARSGPDRYDVVIADLPDPGISQSTKLYSQEFYGLVHRALAPRGHFALYAGSPAARPQSYWTVDATVRAAGLRTAEYRVEGAPGWFREDPERVSGHAGAEPTDWGFVLASHDRPLLRLAPGAPELRSLTEDSLRVAGALAQSRSRHSQRPSTLLHPRYFR